jgi:hypothetical protein
MMESNPAAGQKTACGRCGEPLQVADRRNPEARLLRHAKVPRGLCANCALTQFLLTTEPISNLIKAQPEVLRLPHVQAQVKAVLVANQADASPDEISWERIIANWHLPVAAIGRRRLSAADRGRYADPAGQGLYCACGAALEIEVRDARGAADAADRYAGFRREHAGEGHGLISYAEWQALHDEEERS